MEWLLLGNLAQGMRYITEYQKNQAIKVQKQQQQLKKWYRLGQILISLGYMTKEILSRIIELQKLCKNMTPRLLYPTDTKFGKALTEYVLDKYAVALYITQDNSFIKEQDKLFIADGSHGYYLFLAIAYRGLDVSRIVTNNLGAAGEYVLDAGKLTNTRLKFPSNGVVYRDFGGIFELQKDIFKEEIDSSNIFLSCFAVVPEVDEGFCEDNDIKADIRRELLESTSPVTILCDYNTLSHTHGWHTPVFRGDSNKKWRGRLERSYTRLVTTTHPEMPEQELKYLPTSRTPQAISGSDPPHSWKRYSQNSKLLYGIMGDRFIEVDRSGNKLCYEKKIW